MQSLPCSCSDALIHPIRKTPMLAGANALSKPIAGRMKALFGLGRLGLAVVAVGLMFYAYQYSMSQAIQTVIASQPPMPELMDPPAFDTFRDCDLIPLYESKKPPCKFEPRPPPIEAAPIHQMSKADSEKATLWFMLAALALPLAAVAGYLVMKDL
jgi:hypothetical protein